MEVPNSAKYSAEYSAEFSHWLFSRVNDRHPDSSGVFFEERSKLLQEPSR